MLENAIKLYKYGPPPINYLELFQKSLRKWRELSVQKNSVHDVTCRYNTALIAKVFAQMRTIAQDYLTVEDHQVQKDVGNVRKIFFAWNHCLFDNYAKAKQVKGQRNLNSQAVVFRAMKFQQKLVYGFELPLLNQLIFIRMLKYR